LAKADGGLLAQVHDAGLFLIPISEAADILEEILKRIVVPVEWPELGTMTIPAEMSIGLNWGKSKGKKNPSGLVPWQPGESIHL
jgi:hypothetical protein